MEMEGGRQHIDDMRCLSESHGGFVQAAHPPVNHLLPCLLEDPYTKRRHPASDCYFFQWC